MIEWVIVFMIVSADDPTMGWPQITKTTEANCRQAARTMKYGQDFVADVNGKEFKAKFEFCMWSRDGVIEDYVKPDTTAAE